MGFINKTFLICTGTRGQLMKCKQEIDEVNQSIKFNNNLFK